MGVKTKSNSDLAVKLEPSSFVHLHNHTHHSLLDGLSKIPKLIEAVKEFGMNAVAITDHGTMSGVLELYKAAKNAGIKPIIGMEAYVASRSRLDRDPQKDKARYHLTVLAMNNKGYKNLMKLSTIASLEGMYYKPRIDHEILERYNEGLIILSGCASSELGENLRVDNYKEALKIAKWYKSIFGDRYYLELQDHGHHESKKAWDVQIKINDYLEKIGRELDIPIVVTADAHYISHDDQESHEILLSVGTGAYLSDQSRMTLKDFDLHVTDPKEIISRWSKTRPDAVINTQIIADRCNVEIEMGQILIPTFKTPNGETEKDYLVDLVYKGLAWRYGGLRREQAKTISISEAKKLLPESVIKRAEYELGVIDSMGFDGYFLIVQDFINWGKDKGILFGPGRGSAAGSIVSYAIRITELDPLAYDLLFERFLNPDRISMPDVDIDIQDTRRDEVIAYCVEKYGDARVANIVTFGTMAARAAVRDVARVLQVPYGESDRLAKMIPPPVQGRHIPLATSVVNDLELSQEYQTNPTSKEVLDYAIKLEGTIRSHGVHAAGVVIAPEDIVNLVPMEMSQKGVQATQYTMGYVEDLGLLKMDFLGLSNLTTINNALRIIKKVYKTELNLSEIPLNDKATFKLFQEGDTTGVFQLESAGMRRYLKELLPTVFEDIVAMVALYRPGPMQFIDSFISRKRGKSAITYMHPKMQNALENTYGVLIYQEQVMQISKDLAGFSGGEADTLRKAIGKKLADVMAKMKQRFIDGAVEYSGAKRSDMEIFWKQMEDFAAYCFNKSHAACYGLIAYWTAYLKAHYPDAFMAALMTSDAGDIDRLAIEIAECKHMGINVQLPDINESYVEFAVVPGENEIRFGMAAIKGVGVGVVEEILKAREDGPFVSVEDFARRVSSQKVTKKAWDSLIKTGAFDEMADRSDLLFNLEAIQKYASKAQKEASSGQIDLFGGTGSSVSINPGLSLTPAPMKYTEKQRLAWERELLGLFISAHPLDPYKAYLGANTTPIASLVDDSNAKQATIGGVLTSIRTIITKNGPKMAFAKIEDISSEIEVVIFPTIYEQLKSILVQDAVIIVTGKVSSKDKNGNSSGEIKIIADTIKPLSDEDIKNFKDKKPASNQTEPIKKSAKEKPIPSLPTGRLFLKIDNPDDHELLVAIKSISNDHPGLTELVLVVGDDKKSAIKMPFKVDGSEELINKLAKLIGKEAIALK